VRILTAGTAGAFACGAADFIADRLERRPRSVLALPTGNTPLGPYAELARRSQAGTVDFSAARVFNLDEYCGLPRSDPHSYAAFLHRHLIDSLRLPPAQVRLLRGDAADPRAECRDYDAAIGAWGGIDLCVLGLGRNGHIAFNEPGSPWDLRTHVVELSPSIRADHARQAASPWAIPARGITMGIRSILEAHEVLLLIAGAGKEAAKAALDRGVEDPEWPVTSLLRARELTIIELCGAAGSP
jgi:glucosamine-6-phosphate deaminase